GRGLVRLALLDVRPASRAELAFPALLAIGPDTQEDQILALGTRQEDAILPDHRRRARLAGQWQFPGDVVLLAPLASQAGFLADAVVLRATPGWPVVGTDEGRTEEEDTAERE